MIIKDEDLLDEFRQARRCEVCKKARITDPHHIFAKGVGGGGRLDIAENMLAACRKCHMLIHDGHIKRKRILEIVAAREKKSIDDITGLVYFLLRTPDRRKRNSKGRRHERRRTKKTKDPLQF